MKIGICPCCHRLRDMLESGEIRNRITGKTVMVCLDCCDNLTVPEILEKIGGK